MVNDGGGTQDYHHSLLTCSPVVWWVNPFPPWDDRKASSGLVLAPHPLVCLPLQPLASEIVLSQREVSLVPDFFLSGLVSLLALQALSSSVPDAACLFVFFLGFSRDTIQVLINLNCWVIHKKTNTYIEVWREWLSCRFSSVTHRQFLLFYSCIILNFNLLL